MQRAQRIVLAAVVVLACAGGALAASEFEVKLEEKGPLGLRLVPGSDDALGLSVSDIADQGVVARVGLVRPGDQLIRVNGKKVPGSDFPAAIRMLQQAAWPQTLRFRAVDGRSVSPPAGGGPADGSGTGGIEKGQGQGLGRGREEEDPSWVELEVLSPSVVRGAISARQADFGDTGNCKRYHLVGAGIACTVQQVASGLRSAPVEARGGEGGSAAPVPVLAVASRGRCPFPEKARNAHSAGASALLLIDTGAGGASSLPRMPAGPFDVAALEKSGFETAIVPRRSGAVLKTLLDAGATVTARFRRKGAQCPEEPAEEPAEEPRAEQEEPERPGSGDGAAGGGAAEVEVLADGSVRPAAGKKLSRPQRQREEREKRKARKQEEGEKRRQRQRPPAAAAAAAAAGSRPSRPEDFTLAVWTPGREVVVPVKIALFGAEAFAEEPAPVVSAGLGCSGFGGAKVRDAIVLLDRGECSFEAKARNAQQQGAAALVVVNSDNSATRAGAADPDGIAVPVGMVGKSLGEEVQTALAGSGRAPVAIGRFTGPP